MDIYDLFALERCGQKRCPRCPSRDPAYWRRDDGELIRYYRCWSEGRPLECPGVQIRLRHGVEA